MAIAYLVISGQMPDQELSQSRGADFSLLICRGEASLGGGSGVHRKANINEPDLDLFVHLIFSDSSVARLFSCMLLCSFLSGKLIPEYPVQKNNQSWMTAVSRLFWIASWYSLIL